MNENMLVANWGVQKRSHNYRRLDGMTAAQLEFIGQPGHPTSYSFVRFTSEPSDELSLAFEVEWPPAFDAEYTLRIRNAIAEAVIDVLLAKKDPHRGCCLRLVQFRWDDVGGSERAVYLATAKAMQRLCDEAAWVLVTGRHRQYDRD
jgi:hypothetical protein